MEIEPQSISQHSLEKAQAFAEAYAERKQLASKQDEPAVLSADADESGDASPDAVADTDVSASASASAVSTEPEANEGVSAMFPVQNLKILSLPRVLFLLLLC